MNHGLPILAASRTGIGSLPILFRFSLPIWLRPEPVSGIGSLPILFRFSLPILAASRTGIGSLPIFENLGNAPEPVMERRILVGAAEPVLDMQQYRFWHITAIGQKITSNGSLPLWVVTCNRVVRRGAGVVSVLHAGGE